MKVLRQLDESPFKSLGLGLLVLSATPILAIILLVTVLGIPLGLIALTLYIVALIVGLLIGIAWIGDAWICLLGQLPDQSKGIRALSIVSGAAVLLIIDFIPYVGGWVFFLVMLMGIGAAELYLFRLYVGRANGPTLST